MTDTLQQLVIRTPETGPEAPAPVAPVVTPTPEGTPPATPPKVTRPDWLPSKFKDEKQMAESYAELEKMLAQRSQEPPAATEVTPPAVTPPATTETPAATETPPAQPTVDQVREDLTKNGLSLDKYQNEIIEKGGLTPESYAELASKGYTKELVDGFYNGQKALAQQARATVLKNVASDTDPSGEGTYGAMIAWSQANLTPAEKIAFNNAVTSSTEAASLAVRGLHAQYTAAVGQEPNLINGASGGLEPGNVFRSRNEVTAAMKDPRYGKDPAYTKDVEQKVGRSTVF